MSLTKVRLTDVVKKQYAYKLKAYIQVFTTLIALQLLAIFFSLNGVGSMGSSSESLEMDVHYYSADIVVFFTMLWSFIIAILITTKAYRNDDFVFVTNRVSSNLSNALFLLTASVIGGVTAIMSSYLMKVIMYFFVDAQYLNGTSIMAAPMEWLLGIFSTTCYVFLLGALGYWVGTLIQINKAFALLLPALFFGAFIVEGTGTAKLVSTVYDFIFTESSILLFIVKIIVIAGLLFSSSMVFSNRMEVKQ
ncbi:hypothetical protein [Neobacillus soli]|uniref:hypothetical protein n=1 Tax=Neobacillus soli TaxID=220688 RepID=UPI000826ADC7|nr:hypothetical protein [Neobacillus soli]